VIKHIKIQSDLRGFILIVVAVAWMSGILLASWLPLSQSAFQPALVPIRIT
jgi:hypothetical protein